MIGFEEIYSQYSPQVFRVCMGYVNDRDLALDLTQETFISVWQNLSSFKHQSSISTWIFRIATNNCLRAIERSKRTRTTELPFYLTDIKEEAGHERLAFLYKCIATLDGSERIIISLLLEGLPHAEIASIVGLSSGNVRVRIHRIKEKLAKMFKDHGQFD